jgi:arylsulfatase A-like enzyme
MVETKASTTDDATIDPRFGKVGKQTIVDNGPLPPHPNIDPNAKLNMEVIEPELVRRSSDFIERSVKADKPFFLWHNATRMHVYTHLSPEWKGKTGFGLYADGMAELDWEVGQILKKVDELGIAENTIIMFTSDNGAEIFTWPDGGNHPFRGEKGTTYEGGFRVPLVVKWPGVIKPGTVNNDIISHEDWLPTLLAAAGEPDIKTNLMPRFKGEVEAGPRREIFYFNNSGDLLAVRYDAWKTHFKTVEGNLYTGALHETQVPYLTNLRQDPWERYQKESMAYGTWWGEKTWTLTPSIAVVGQFLQSFKEYPASQKSASFSVEQALAALQKVKN